MKETLQQKIMSADIRGAPEGEKKLLYQEQNALGLDQSSAIYRIFQLPYLVADIRMHQLTHVRPSPDLWIDPYENPLLKKVFAGDNPGERISLRGIIEKLYALSWTLAPTESMDFWDEFSHGRAVVRMKTTVSKLLAGIMSLDNRFYMLSHFVGRVEYYEKEEIEE